MSVWYYNKGSHTHFHICSGFIETYEKQHYLCTSINESKTLICAHICETFKLKIHIQYIFERMDI